MKTQYDLIAIIGPSGAGKHDILKEILLKYPQLNRVMHCTTNPIEHQILDSSYQFMSTDIFTNNLLNDKLLDAAIVNDYAYGTAISALSSDAINIGIFYPSSFAGFENHFNIFNTLLIIFLETEDKIRFLRLLNRSSDVDEIIKQYQADKISFYALSEDIDIPIITFQNNTENDRQHILKQIGVFLDVIVKQSSIGQ